VGAIRATSFVLPFFKWLSTDGPTCSAVVAAMRCQTAKVPRPIDAGALADLLGPDLVCAALEQFRHILRMWRPEWLPKIYRSAARSDDDTCRTCARSEQYVFHELPGVILRCFLFISSRPSPRTMVCSLIWPTIGMNAMTRPTQRTDV